jgi:hypothetical protein
MDVGVSSLTQIISGICVTCILGIDSNSNARGNLNSKSHRKVPVHHSSELNPLVTSPREQQEPARQQKAESREPAIAQVAPLL